MVHNHEDVPNKAALVDRPINRLFEAILGTFFREKYKSNALKRVLSHYMYFMVILIVDEYIFTVSKYYIR